MHKDPTLALELAMAAVHDAQDALAQHLLHFAHEAADLADQLSLNIFAEPAVRLVASSGVAFELRVEGVPAEDLLERALHLARQQLK